MIPVVAEVAALFTDKFAVHAAKSNEWLVVELTSAKRCRLVIRLGLRRLSNCLLWVLLAMLVSQSCCLVNLIGVEMRRGLFDCQVGIIKALIKKIFLTVWLSQVDFVRQLKYSLLVFVGSNQSGTVFLRCLYFNKRARCWREKSDLLVWVVVAEVKSVAVVGLKSSLHLVKYIGVLKHKAVVGSKLAHTIFSTVALFRLLRS